VKMETASACAMAAEMAARWCLCTVPGTSS
jgi:hypothetical protein